VTEFKLVHSGFDKFDAAFQGAMDPALFPILAAAKEDAQRSNRAHLVTLGPERVDAHVSDRGMRGGYAFHLDTGPLGANLFVKEHVGLKDWNLFAASRAEALLAYGFAENWRRTVESLRGLGATVGAESINRIDFAMDFATHGFRLAPERFVAPARTKKRINYADDSASPAAGPVLVLEGRDVQSVTLGRMPGRQVVVYDKSAEAKAKHKLFWFEAWGVDPRDPDIRVFRVELRAGKHHLKEDRGLSTFHDIHDSAGDVFLKMADDFRYIEPLQPGKNVTRAPLAPLWHAVKEALQAGLAGHRSGLLPGRIIEIERQRKRETCLDNIAGNAAALAVVDGIAFAEASARLPDHVAAALRTRVDADPGKLAMKMERVERRYRFLLDPNKMPPI
jgi:hypothetical protein